MTQIWLDQLPKFFKFFADEKIFDQKDLGYKTYMMLFCESIMTTLKTEKNRASTIPSEEDFAYILTGNPELKDHNVPN